MPGGVSQLEQAQPEPLPQSGTLVAFFSKTGETYGLGNVEKGNTRLVAEIIALRTGADLFEIRSAKPYPESYQETTEIARMEKNTKARPALLGVLPDFSVYSRIFLGYPIWWSDMPMPLYSFLRSAAPLLEKKTIIPFCTHEGSGFCQTARSISEMLPSSRVLYGRAFYGHKVHNNRESTLQEVDAWLEALKRR